MTRKKTRKEQAAKDDRLAARRAVVLNQMPPLYGRFRKPRGRGDRTFAAMFALDGFFGLSTQLNPEFPSDREKQEHYLIPVPLWALQYLLQAFLAYRTADAGRTFGEVLGIEGGGQGRRPAKESLAVRSVQLLLARLVHRRQTELKAAGKSKHATLERV